MKRYLEDMPAPAPKEEFKKESAAANFERLIADAVRVTLAASKDLKGMEKLAEATIKELVDAIVRYAYVSGASDVHVDPAETFLVVRYRIDGILHDVLSLPKKMQPMIMTRVKVISEMRTDEHQAPQDGRFRLIFDGNVPVDVRVSIVPTFYGENMVMRLLVGHAKMLSLEDLGLNERDLKTVAASIRKSYGMILATGPTGSGKTTSLYSILQILNTRDRSIITIEDPVEYAVPGVTQIPVNAQAGLTFATGLRSIVRQDPNTIMVGEIRDEETANIAVNAAMTGHLLLSTLHTNDSAVTLPRLLDMGIEPFLIASTVNVAIGQRLIRKVCAACVTSRALTELERASLVPLIPAKILASFKAFAEPVGCAVCHNTGYVGRVGIYEVLEVSESIRHMIMQRENADEIRKKAVEEGMTTMLMDGLQKAANGQTSITEVLRVIHE